MAAPEPGCPYTELGLRPPASPPLTDGSRRHRFSIAAVQQIGGVNRVSTHHIVLVGQRGTITIPKDMRQALDLEVGARLTADLVDGALVLRPVRVTTDDRARRRRLIEETNAAYAHLREDPAAWEQHLKEREEWDATLADGLEPADG